MVGGGYPPTHEDPRDSHLRGAGHDVLRVAADACRSSSERLSTAAPATTRTEVVIRPPGRFGELGLRELWRPSRAPVLPRQARAAGALQAEPLRGQLGGAAAARAALSFSRCSSDGWRTISSSDGCPIPLSRWPDWCRGCSPPRPSRSAATSRSWATRTCSRRSTSRGSSSRSPRSSRSAVDLLISLVVLCPFMIALRGRDRAARRSRCPRSSSLAVRHRVGIGVVAQRAERQVPRHHGRRPAGRAALAVRHARRLPRQPGHRRRGSTSTRSIRWSRSINGVRWALLGHRGARRPAVADLDRLRAWSCSSVSLIYFKRTERYFADII